MTEVGCDVQLAAVKEELKSLRQAQNGKTAFERHAQTVLVLILVAILLWVGKTTQETAVAIAELKVEVGHLHTQADGDKNKFDNIERRLDAIESQLSQLTNGVSE